MGEVPPGGGEKRQGSQLKFEVPLGKYVISLVILLQIFKRTLFIILYLQVQGIIKMTFNFSKLGKKGITFSKSFYVNPAHPVDNRVLQTFFSSFFSLQLFFINLVSLYIDTMISNLTWPAPVFMLFFFFS